MSHLIGTLASRQNDTCAEETTDIKKKKYFTIKLQPTSTSSIFQSLSAVCDINAALFFSSFCITVLLKIFSCRIWYYSKITLVVNIFHIFSSPFNVSTKRRRIFDGDNQNICHLGKYPSQVFQWWFNGISRQIQEILWWRLESTFYRLWILNVYFGESGTVYVILDWCGCCEPVWRRSSWLCYCENTRRRWLLFLQCIIRII